MRKISHLTMLLVVSLAITSYVVAWSAASAQTLTTLASFNKTDGWGPGAGLIADANGDLFGTTLRGGASNVGTVFEIVKTANGYATAPTTLVSFDGTDGVTPAGLIADANGNLFGTTYRGGPSEWGTVFEILKTASGYATVPTILASFDNSTDGAAPLAGVMADSGGDLIGTTSAYAGASGYGTVFEIAKTASGYAATPSTLVSFDGSNGAYPDAGLIADANGNLFGTTGGGGSSGYGTVFEIAKTSSGYAATPTTLVSFDNGADGGSPEAGLIIDASGNLFGTTLFGGASGFGTVFEIAKSSSGYATTPTTLVSFDAGADGGEPSASLIEDSKGNLFGTTSLGGASDFGTIFEIAKTAGGYASTPALLVSFDGSNGAQPLAGLIADGKGNLFGTTYSGGASGYGTVFKVTGIGFVTPTEFPGTPGTLNCNGNSVSALSQTYGGLAQAAAALGYNSVTALQRAISAFCSQ